MKENISIITGQKIPLLHRVMTPIILIAVLFGPGLVFDSSAMQWAGFIILIFFAFGVMVNMVEARKEMSLDEAEARLREIRAKVDQEVY